MRIIYILLIVLSMCFINTNLSYGIPKHNKSSMDLEFTIDGKGFFEFRFGTFISIDVYETHQVFYGKYIMKNDTLIFDDKIYKLKVKGVMYYDKITSAKKIRFIEGPEFLLKTNVRFTENYKTSELSSGLKDFRFNTKDFERYAKRVGRKKVKYDFNFGNYLYIYEGTTFSLNFNGDGSFIYSIDNKVVSKGKWEKKNNLILLYDQDVSQTWTVAITADNEIEPGRLPFSCIGLLIKFTLEEK